MFRAVDPGSLSNIWLAPCSSGMSEVMNMVWEIASSCRPEQGSVFLAIFEVGLESAASGALHSHENTNI